MGEGALIRIRETMAFDRVNGKKMYTAFSALGDPSRFLIFKMLINNHGILCVSDVAKILDVSISAASQQLRALEKNELVKRRRLGQKICYKVKYKNPVVQSLIEVMGI